MLSSLFVNMAILISFIFLASQGFKHSPESLKSIKGKLAAGLSGGALGIILMLYSIRVHGETLVDFRFIPVVLLAFYTTSASTLTAAAAISAFRLFFYGINQSSILGAAATILIAVGCIVMRYIKLRKLLKFTYMFLYSLFIIITVLTILLKGSMDFFGIITSYSGIYIISGIIVYKLSEYIVESNKLYLQFKEQASRDFLTGLNNVRQFDHVINEAFKRVRELGERLSVLALDIDHFKKVNDTYGHDGGDAVLRQLGEVLKSSCRPFDIVSRVGGEEFSVILLDCPNSQAVEVAERIRKSVKNRSFVLPDGTVINITISIGVATYPESTENLDELVKQADIELYKAKESGRNKVCSLHSRDCE